MNTNYLLHKPEFSIAGVLWVFLFLAILGLMIVIKKRWDRKLKKKEGVRNLIWVVTWLSCITCLFFSLYCFKVFHQKGNTDEPFMSEVDGLVMLMSVIGIIGAIWAVFARIDAEKAFNAANDAKEKALEAKDQAFKTYKSFGNSFDFIDILDDDRKNERLPFIIDKIGSSNTTVSLYLGFPCVGCLYKDYIHYTKNINKVFNGFVDKIGFVIDADHPFTLNLAVFDAANINKFIKKSGFDKLEYQGDNLFIRYFEKLKTLEKKINDPNWNKEKIIKIVRLTPETEKFRFASVYRDPKKFNIDYEENQINRALIWVVPDLLYDKNFDSAGFQTGDAGIIQMLQKVFECSKSEDSIEWAYNPDYRSGSLSIISKTG